VQRARRYEQPGSALLLSLQEEYSVQQHRLKELQQTHKSAQSNCTTW
jgi:hypothetical protein